MKRTTSILKYFILGCVLSLGQPIFAAQNLGLAQWEKEQHRYDEALKKLPPTLQQPRNNSVSNKLEHPHTEIKRNPVTQSTYGTALRVNINTANADELSAKLKGIGVKKAQAIIEYRQQHGRFKTIDELTQVKGIGIKTLEKNKAVLAVD